MIIGLLYLATPFIFYWLNEEYSGGAKYVIWIALGYFFRGIYFLAVQYFMFENKTKIIMYLSSGAIVLNLFLNYFLIDIFGTIGAAYATTISFASLGIISILLSNYIYPMPWYFGLKTLLLNGKNKIS